VLAEAELQRNRERLLAEAEHVIETWPGFARWRAQNSEPMKSAASAVQMSGAEGRAQQ
jgi:hypothetical protein